MSCENCRWYDFGDSAGVVQWQNINLPSKLLTVDISARCNEKPENTGLFLLNCVAETCKILGENLGELRRSFRSWDWNGRVLWLVA